METINCEHKFIFQRSDSSRSDYGYRGYKYIRVDAFYCEKCLEIKEVSSEHVTHQGNFEERPEWCKSIDKQK